MEELDKNFSSLVQSQVLLSMTEPSKMNALKALVSKDIPDGHVKSDGKKIETNKQVYFYMVLGDLNILNVIILCF